MFASSLLATPEQAPERRLSRIAHEHVSLGIRPDQHQVVHALVQPERVLYGSREVSADTVWRQWPVEERITETDDVVTFVLAATDDRLVAASLPGQHVSVQVQMPDGTHQPRQCSLTRADDGSTRQISVKRVRGGGVLDGGALDGTGRPVVLASAGIGITPMAGMLSHLAAAGSTSAITLLHADEQEASVALRRQVLGDVAALPRASAHVWYERGADAAQPAGGVHEGFRTSTTSGCRMTPSTTRWSTPTCGRPTRAPSRPGAPRRSRRPGSPPENLAPPEEKSRSWTPHR